MASSVLLGRLLRRQIRARVWPVLEEEGFLEFAPLRAFRRDGEKVEVVEFAPVRPEWREPRWLGGEAYANGATFTLHIGTYFLQPTDEKPIRPKAHECHRALRLAHESMESPTDGRTFWPGQNGERLDAIVDEAVRVLKARGLNELAKHRKGDPCEARRFEEVGLSSEEAEEMMRICREGRMARAEALQNVHRQIHLADERLVV